MRKYAMQADIDARKQQRQALESIQHSFEFLSSIGSADDFLEIDADLPCPEQLRAGTITILPEIQTMSGYIHDHYEKEILAELTEKIKAGEIGVPIDGQIFYNSKFSAGPLPWTGPEDYGKAEAIEPPAVTVLSGHIHRISLRRVGCDMVNAELTLILNLKIRRGADRQAEYSAQWYRANIWLDMEDGIAGDYGRYRIYHYEEPDEGLPLDDYLVPILSMEGIEREAAEILFRVCPKALSGSKYLQAESFARALGLQIQTLPLYDRARTSSILFFTAGDALICEKEDATEESRPVHVHVPARTIVLNRNYCLSSGTKNAVFHECFHYIEHRLFFQLQRMHNSDIALLSAYRPVKLKSDERDPIDWIEWQAQYGSQCLQMERELLKRRVTEELSAMQSTNAHMGDKLHAIGRKLALEFDVPNYRMRNRMIHIGFQAAKGALNFVNGKYIRPFAFDLSECRGSKTFVVSEKDVLCEYLRSEAFREILDAHRYVYAEGHLCLDDSQYVRYGTRCVSLTRWANAHVDRCCLRFEIIYTRDERTRYVFGQLNSDDEYNAHSLSLSLTQPGVSAMECARAMAGLLMELPGSFSGSLRAHMERCGVTIEALSERTGISVRTINRLRNEDRSAYALEQVVVLCLALHLPPEFSADMIEKAGLRLRNRPEDLIYGVILRTMFMEPLNAIQKALRECGCPELKLKEVV